MPAHAHDANADTNGNHSHTFSIYEDESWGGPGAAAGGSSVLGAPTTSISGGHVHNITVSKTGNSQPFTMLPPYIPVYIWKRLS